MFDCERFLPSYVLPGMRQSRGRLDRFTQNDMVAGIDRLIAYLRETGDIDLAKLILEEARNGNFTPPDLYEMIDRGHYARTGEVIVDDDRNAI